MIVLTKLILAHLTGDFVLQPKGWVADKERYKIRSLKLFLHVLLHGGLIILLLWDIGYWLLAGILTITHLMIDLLKIYFQKEHNQTSWFLADQAMHLGSILILYYVWFRPEWHISLLVLNPNFWLLITILLFLTVVTAVLIRFIMLNWSLSIKNSEAEEDSLSKAGTYIGILERLFIFVFVVSGNWASIGFLLTAKSVFRFGDLREAKDRKLTEYILIGTLVSFGIAIISGMVFLWLTDY